MAAELSRIGPQLLSELCFDLRRQSEVLPLRIERTNLVTDCLQLLAQRLAPSRHRLTTEQAGKQTILLRNMVANRQACAFFPANCDLVLHNQLANVLESHGSLVQLDAVRPRQ